MTSGNKTVDAMGMMNISGNVIPQIWYSTITRPNGKPNLLAITLLADIVYWYRPTEVRDEQTGRVVGWKKRFKGQLLQKSYQQYEITYGESKRSVKAALQCLEDLGVIRKEFRDVPCENGMVLHNLMFIALNADVLHHLTYPDQLFQSKEAIENEDITEECTPILQSNVGGGIEDGKGYDKTMYYGVQNDVGDGTKFCRGYDKMMHHGVQNDVGRGTNFCKDMIQQNVPTPTTNCNTNTKNKTQSTNIEHNNPINQESDAMDKINIYTQIIKENIEYGILKDDVGHNNGLVDEIVELIVETISVERESVRINGTEYPYQLVKSRLLKLDYEHVRYVIDCMQKNTTKITNIRAYMLTALFNAPTTISNYYQAEVNHDLY